MIKIYSVNLHRNTNQIGLYSRYITFSGLVFYTSFDICRLNCRWNVLQATFHLSVDCRRVVCQLTIYICDLMLYVWCWLLRVWLWRWLWRWLWGLLWCWLWLLLRWFVSLNSHVVLALTRQVMWWDKCLLWTTVDTLWNLFCFNIAICKYMQWVNIQSIV